VNPLLQTDLPILHIFGNSLSTAKELLRKQAGVIDFKPLEPLFVEAAQIQAMGTFMNRFEDVRPFTTFADIQQRFEAGLGATTAGRFSEAIHAFESALHACLLAILEPGEAVDTLIAEAREYILGLRMEVKRKELLASSAGSELPAEAAKRVLELACYFTACGIRPEHLALALRSAMNLAFKLKEYGLAARMARRLIELNPGEPALSQAQKVAMAAAKMASAPSESSLEIDYDDHVDFTVDAGKFRPIYAGMPTVHCPLCQAAYDPAQEGSVCRICLVAGVGLKTTGIQLYLSN
jgi:coatomer protein complex subunit alpha (xenin)